MNVIKKIRETEGGNLILNGHEANELLTIIRQLEKEELRKTLKSLKERTKEI